MSTERTDVVFGAKIADLLAGMTEAREAVTESTELMKASLESLEATASALLGPFLLIAAALEGGEIFKESIAKTAELAVQLEVLSQKTGMSVEDLSRLQYAADMAHVSVETLTVSFQRLARGLEAAAKGSGPAKDALDALGIRATTAAGQLRPMQDVMLDLAARFAAMPDGAQKTALAMDLFGRSGANMIPFLNQGREGIERLTAEADRLHITMSAEGVRAAVAYEEAMKRLEGATGGVERQIALGLMPALSSVASVLAEAATKGQAFAGIGEIVGLVFRTIASSAVLAYTWAHEVVLALIALADASSKSWTQVGLDLQAMGKAGSDAIDTIKQLWAAVAEAPKPPEAKGGEVPLPTGDADRLRLLEIQWAREKRENADHFGDLAQMELDFWKKKIGAFDANTKEYASIAKHISDLTVQIAQQGYAGELAAMQAQEALDKDNKQQVLADRLEELALIRKHYAEASKEVQDGVKRVNEAQHAIVEESAKTWEEAFHALPTAFGHATSEIGKSVKSLSDLFRTFFKDLLVMGIESGAASLAHHVAIELAKKNITAASVLDRVAVETWGAIQTVAKSVWAALVQVANYAAVAAAGAYAAIASIPVVGPVLAPVAAGVALAGVIGLAGSLRSASGGYDVPAGINPMTQLHAQEMVLPASLANAVRAMAAGGGSGGSGHTYQITAVDAKSFVELCKSNPDAIGHGVAGAVAMNHGAMTKALKTRGG